VGLADVHAIAVGNESACAVALSGALSCWGANEHGQLGDGTLVDRPSPVTVVSLGGIVEAALGYEHGCALKTDGSVWCWGDNAYGQLGDGTRASRPTATAAVIGITTAAHLAAWLEHTCAVLKDGSVWCWGRNNVGQLGDGTTTDRPTPVRAGTIANAVEITAGGEATPSSESHTCARGSDGSVYCWGDNSFGELGDSSTTTRTTPTHVQGLPAAAAIGAGGRHSCAALAAGGAMCWGDDAYGELGTIPGQASSVPATTQISCP
jgi:alpha-tubulin suppressor-like RCC1 family protein